MAAAVLAVLEVAATIFYTNAFQAIFWSWAASKALGAIFSRDTGDGGSMSTTSSRQQLIRSSISPRNIIYGRIVTSGTLVFAATTNKAKADGTIAENAYLHMVIVLAAHEVQEIGEIFLNGNPLGQLTTAGTPISGKYFKGSTETVKEVFTVVAGQNTLSLASAPAQIISAIQTGQYINEALPYTLSGQTLSFAAYGMPRTVTVTYTVANSESYVKVKKYLGTANQTADPELVTAIGSARWTSAHRLRGIAYLYVRLEWEPDLYETGIPNITAGVDGKKVFDPRTNTTVFSDNWALCVNDYLRSPEGFGMSADDVDTASVIAAANISDEILSYNPVVIRYQAHGTCYADKTPETNLNAMLSAAGGTVILSGGVMRVHAGAYDVPTITLTEDDLRGPIKLQARTARKDLFNAVAGTYVEGNTALSTWQPVDFPLVTNSYYQTQDGGVQIVRDIELPFTRTTAHAQRLAKLTLDRARQGITVEFPAKLSGFKLRAWDTVSVTLEKFGWSAKVFRVAEWVLNADGSVNLTLKEEASAAYAWNGGAPLLYDPAADTALPVPGYVPALTNLTLASGSTNLLKLGDGTLVVRIKVAWAATTAVLIKGSGQIQIEYQFGDDAQDVWLRLPGLPGDATIGYISNVIVGRIYIVRARLISRRGVVGAWTYSSPHTVIGKEDLPGDVPFFIIDGNRLKWGAVPDVDLAGYQIRFQYGSNTTWSTAAALHDGLLNASPFDPVMRPQGQLTLMIKAVDTSGNQSANTVAIVGQFQSSDVSNVIEVFDLQAIGYADTFIEE
jgi:hypothetical protein